MKNLLSILYCLSVFKLSAQDALLYNNGTTFFASNNTIVKVGGTVNNALDGVIYNNGAMTVDENYINNWITRGSGEYLVAGNWINNRSFIRETSTVFLNGNNQIIGGDSITTFYNLVLEGGGVKTQEINSITANNLNLNDRELATQTFDMWVSNTAPNAILRTTGFVSSLGNGKLARSMTAPTTYLFPTGSSLVTERYRPVEIVHSNTQLAQYGVRLANNDATLDGYNRNNLDDIVCTTNPLFYHLISKRDGVGDADIRIFYNAAIDDVWEGIANYRDIDNAWVDISPVQVNTTNPLVNNEKLDYNEFVYEPYILSRIRPEAPEILGNFALCGGLSAMYSAANPQSGTTYTWGATNGDLSNTIGTQTSINWFNVGDGTVTLTATSANGCSSLPTTENVSIGTSPTAAFTFNPPAGFGTDYFQFTDQSQGANTWNWTFGNTGNSDVQNPGHTFNFSDNHIVVLVVTSEDGCTDTTFAIVPIIEGFEIPNVFTPNGDGVNDVFQISGSGFNTYKCQIFNRWGNLVFESSAPQISWDGKTLAGVKAPSGVYFVILEVDTPTEPIKYNGTLTLLDPQ